MKTTKKPLNWKIIESVLLTVILIRTTGASLSRSSRTLQKFAGDKTPTSNDGVYAYYDE